VSRPASSILIVDHLNSPLFRSSAGSRSIVLRSVAFVYRVSSFSCNSLCKFPAASPHHDHSIVCIAVVLSTDDLELREVLFRQQAGLERYRCANKCANRTYFKLLVLIRPKRSFRFLQPRIGLAAIGSERLSLVSRPIPILFH